MPPAKKPKATARPEPKLSDEIRREIVVRLAMYDSPTEIAVWVKEEYGITIAKASIQHYDPSNGKRLAKKWVDLFHDSRTHFLSEINKTPIAHRAWRLRQLERDYLKIRDKDPDAARKMLEQAAKEVEGYFRPAKAAIAPSDIPNNQRRTPDESRNMLADRLVEGIKRLPQKAGQKPSVQ